MFKLIFYFLVILSNLPRITPCVALYGQCGGIGYSGSTQCCSPATCQYNNDYYSQCLTGTTTTVKTTSTASGRTSTGCNALYSQCGGQSWTGSTCCINSVCTFANNYYSQCLAPSTASTSTTKGSTSTTKPSTSTTKVSTSTTKLLTSTTQSSTSTTKLSTSTTKVLTTTTTTAQGCSAAYGQCGGTGWSGPTTCCSGSTCQFVNNYYYQCMPISTSSTSTKSTSTSSTTVVNDGRVSGVTTRYWDCCKASCGWPGKASVTNPVLTCKADGVTPIDANTQSGCTGGTAYMCNNQQPWNVSSTLSYGYAAAYITGQSESTWCCACYSLLFTTGPVAGKELVVQVTNTGGDLGNNHFDLQMPGGGFGIFDGCNSQFPGSYSWGQTYGGISQRSDCYNLPSVLLSGCLWRFDWFQNADNPQMRFKQVSCPTALTKNTNCIRQ